MDEIYISISSLKLTANNNGGGGVGEVSQLGNSADENVIREKVAIVQGDEEFSEVKVNFQETFLGHTSPISRSRFSASENNIASASKMEQSGLMRQAFLVWDLWERFSSGACKIKVKLFGQQMVVQPCKLKTLDMKWLWMQQGKIVGYIRLSQVANISGGFPPYLSLIPLLSENVSGVVQLGCLLITEKFHLSLVTNIFLCYSIHSFQVRGYGNGLKTLPHTAAVTSGLATNSTHLLDWFC